MRDRHRSWVVAALSLLASALVACDPPDLTPSSQVIRLRVLAIETDPPEMAFGDTVTLTPVIADPWDEGYSAQWMPCIETQLGGFAACDFDNMLVDLDNPFALTALTSEQLTFTVDQPAVEALLAEMDAVDRAQGVSLQFLLMLLPRDRTFLDYLPEFDPAQIDDPDYLEQYGEQAGEALNDLFEALIRQSRIAFKRVIVSDLDSLGIAAHDDGPCAALPGLAANRAPDLGGIVQVVEGVERALPHGATLVVEAGGELELKPLWNPDDQQDYYHVAWSGATECRQESPYFGWYTTAGGFNSPEGFGSEFSYLSQETGLPQPMVWQAPDEPPVRNPVELWTVVWDRRGGISHVPFRVEVLP